MSTDRALTASDVAAIVEAIERRNAEQRGYQRAVAALHDLAAYKRWHAEQLATTGVDHHQWNSTARLVLANYLEWLAAQTPGDTDGH